MPTLHTVSVMVNKGQQVSSIPAESRATVVVPRPSPASAPVSAPISAPVSAPALPLAPAPSSTPGGALPSAASVPIVPNHTVVETPSPVHPPFDTHAADSPADPVLPPITPQPKPSAGTPTPASASSRTPVSFPTPEGGLPPVARAPLMTNHNTVVKTPAAVYPPVSASTVATAPVVPPIVAAPKPEPVVKLPVPKPPAPLSAPSTDSGITSPVSAILPPTPAPTPVSTPVPAMAEPEKECVLVAKDPPKPSVLPPSVLLKAPVEPTVLPLAKLAPDKEKEENGKLPPVPVTLNEEQQLSLVNKVSNRLEAEIEQLSSSSSSSQIRPKREMKKTVPFDEQATMSSPPKKKLRLVKKVACKSTGGFRPPARVPIMQQQPLPPVVVEQQRPKKKKKVATNKPPPTPRFRSGRCAQVTDKAMCDVCFLVESEGDAPFCRCTSCALVVHESCFSAHDVNENTGDFLCDVCTALQTNQLPELTCAPKRNKNRKLKLVKVDSPDPLPFTIEANSDGRLYESSSKMDVFCQLCLRRDVMGGMKFIQPASDNDDPIFAHLACIMSTQTAFFESDLGAVTGIPTAVESSKRVQRCIRKVTGKTSECDACEVGGGLLV
eukprot:scaffold34239_cov46-Attheya_sp.AAC.1